MIPYLHNPQLNVYNFAQGVRQVIACEYKKNNCLVLFLPLLNLCQFELIHNALVNLLSFCCLPMRTDKSEF